MMNPEDQIAPTDFQGYTTPKEKEKALFSRSHVIA